MKKLIFSTALAFCMISLSGRDTINLNSNWNFVFGYEVKRNVWDRVELPHTWNNVDAHYKLDYYRGQATYMKEQFFPKAWEGKRLFLRFNGVNEVADVFINERWIGEHRGGYTAFVFDISDEINYGEINEIRVRVSNALHLDVMPLVGDFIFYGGIYRDVNLIVTEPTCISPLQYASSGVYLTQANVSEKNALVGTKVLINQKSKQANLYRVLVEIKDKNKLITSTSQEFSLEGDSEIGIHLPLEINNPRLWNGVKDPFMYQVHVSIKDQQGKVIDQVQQPLGLRYFHVDRDKGFFLNGEYLQLRGVNRHQDWSEVGNALYPKHHKKDIEIIEEMGANAVRLAHYPHDEYVYHLLNETGILVWSEIPFVGPGGHRNKGFINKQSFKENGKLQLTELIHQQYNHPSIFCWGVFNEINMHGDNPYDYLVDLNKLAKSLDSTRLTTSASNVPGAINEVTDLVAWNRYYGWYEGQPHEISVWADTLFKNNPAIKLGVSEYGAGGSIYHHQQKLEKAVHNAYWHPEEWQTYYHIENWKVLDKKDFLWGTFIWNMFDFGAAHRTEGDRPARNDKGLVTFDRKVKKDAFWFYKANWNKDEPVLYIANRRFDRRTENSTSITVFSNYNNVELLVNGKSHGTVSGDDYATFIWDNIELKNGKNHIKVVSKDDGTEQIDSCFWYVENWPK